MANYGTIEISSSSKDSAKAVATVEETDSLLSAHNGDVDDETGDSDGVTTKYLMAFYASHALFMWNNRCYEFAVVLFTASAFPGTLVEASIRGFCAHLASVLFSPSLGCWLNQYARRLWPVQSCILTQRLCIALACLGWMPLMVGQNDAHPKDPGSQQRTSTTVIAFSVLVIIGMLERLSAVANLAIVEREWLPLLASQRTTKAPIDPDDSTANEYSQPVAKVQTISNLHILNATTKRIDLITKLIAPLAVSRLVISTDIKRGALVLAGFQIASGGLELLLTRLVWRNCKAMQDSCSPTKGPMQRQGSCTELPSPSLANMERKVSSTWTMSIRKLPLINGFSTWIDSFATYLRNPISLPSLAYVLEPFSVLTLAGSMTAYLLATNFSLNEITFARAASTAVEIASTVLTPFLISWMSKRSGKVRVDDIRPLTTVGIIGLIWQLVCLLPVTTMFLLFPGLNGSATESKYASITTLLFAGLALSRLGPFAYSLVEQQLVQVRVAPSERVKFSSVETALFDVSELARWCMLMVFSTSEHFRWAALLSFGSVVLSLVMVLIWVRRQKQEPLGT